VTYPMLHSKFLAQLSPELWLLAFPTGALVLQLPVGMQDTREADKGSNPARLKGVTSILRPLVAREALGMK
jgi:hypothetical protein